MHCLEKKHNSWERLEESSCDLKTGTEKNREQRMSWPCPSNSANRDSVNEIISATCHHETGWAGESSHIDHGRVHPELPMRQGVEYRGQVPDKHCRNNND